MFCDNYEFNGSDYMLDNFLQEDENCSTVVANNCAETPLGESKIQAGKEDAMCSSLSVHISNPYYSPDCKVVNPIYPVRAKRVTSHRSITPEDIRIVDKRQENASRNNRKLLEKLGALGYVDHMTKKHRKCNFHFNDYPLSMFVDP